MYVCVHAIVRPRALVHECTRADKCAYVVRAHTCKTRTPSHARHKISETYPNPRLFPRPCPRSVPALPLSLALAPVSISYTASKDELKFAFDSLSEAEKVSRKDKTAPASHAHVYMHKCGRAHETGGEKDRQNRCLSHSHSFFLSHSLSRSRSRALSLTLPRTLSRTLSRTYDGHLSCASVCLPCVSVCACARMRQQGVLTRVADRIRTFAQVCTCPISSIHACA